MYAMDSEHTETCTPWIPDRDMYAMDSGPRHVRPHAMDSPCTDADTLRADLERCGDEVDGHVGCVLVVRLREDADVDDATASGSGGWIERDGRGVIDGGIDADEEDGDDVEPALDGRASGVESGEDGSTGGGALLFGEDVVLDVLERSDGRVAGAHAEGLVAFGGDRWENDLRTSAIR